MWWSVCLSDSFEASERAVQLAGSETVHLLVFIQWGCAACLGGLHAPSCDISVFMEYLEAMLLTLPIGKIISGDFNIDLNKEDSLDNYSHKCEGLYKAIYVSNQIWPTAKTA